MSPYSYCAFWREVHTPVVRSSHSCAYDVPFLPLYALSSLALQQGQMLLQLVGCSPINVSSVNQV